MLLILVSKQLLNTLPFLRSKKLGKLFQFVFGKYAAKGRHIAAAIYNTDGYFLLIQALAYIGKIGTSQTTIIIDLVAIFAAFAIKEMYTGGNHSVFLCLFYNSQRQWLSFKICRPWRLHPHNQEA